MAIQSYYDFKLGDRLLSDFGGVLSIEENYKTDIKPALNVATEKIVGYDGEIPYSATYDPRVINLHMKFKNNDLNADELTSWLKSRKPQWFNYVGSDRKIEVICKDELELSTYSPTYHSMDLTLYAYNPYWVEIEPYVWLQNAPVVNQQYVFMNSGNEESYPLIKLNSNQTVTEVKFEINGVPYKITELLGEVIIDCKYGTVYKQLPEGKRVNKLNTFSCTDTNKNKYYMPILKVGSNTFKLLSSSLDNIKIQCNSRWI